MKIARFHTFITVSKSNAITDVCSNYISSKCDHEVCGLQSVVCSVQSANVRHRPTGRFSKLPVITGPVRLFCFPFQMGVSKGLKIVQLRYRLKKQNWLYYRSQHMHLFLKLWSQNIIRDFGPFFEKRAPGTGLGSQAVFEIGGNL